MTDSLIVNEFDTVRSADPRDGLIELPVIAAPGAVVFPNVIVPLSVPDGRALSAVQHAINAGRTLILLAYREPPDSRDRGEAPRLEALYSVGTEIALSQIMPMGDGRRTVLAQGRRRVEVLELVRTEPYLVARARLLPDAPTKAQEVDVLVQTVLNLFQHAADLNDSIPDDVLDFALSIYEPGWLADFVASTLSLSTEERQRLLEMTAPYERLREVARLLSRELNMLELRDEITGQIQQEMNRNQREMYLREQMRVIQGELGEEDVFQQELTELRTQISEAGLPEEINARALKELSRLAIMPPMAPEVGIIRTYIDWLVSLPWNKQTEDLLDMAHAQSVLDAEHYGLPKVKDRILEHIAVRKLAAEKMKTPILCFVGPPGVGKTSLGRSIAKALGREFVRVSLGGVRDEAEIRGHRRTYIGALPGRILQTMRRAGTVNPVFMLDEIDKIGADFRGDPSAALLEVLDPEQNHEYSDHYLDVPYDLSKVMFITTANDLDPLPGALLDRLEVIEFPGYSEEEKLQIARQFLIPEQSEGHGLSGAGLRFETGALQTIVRAYTYEAGVRNLNREIANICRKVARLIAEGRPHPQRIGAAQIEKFLGPPEFLPVRANQVDSVGLATGLAWTYGGGDVLSIEVSVLPGKGTLMMTGQLGEVMQESAQTALSYMRSRAVDFDVPSDDFENYDVHVHMLEGAIPKEGPSAGITLAVAIISAFSERKIRADFAMTGEISLRGRVLPVGGIKEKVMAAHRARLRHIILPAQNRKDLRDLPASTLRGVEIHFVETMEQVLDLVLLDPPAEGRLRDQQREKEEREKEAREAARKRADDDDDGDDADEEGDDFDAGLEAEATEQRMAGPVADGVREGTIPAEAETQP